MKKLLVLTTLLLSNVVYSQITVINTGTSDNLFSILKFQTNYLIAGSQNYLSKCYNGCDTLIPLSVPVFPNLKYRMQIERPDTNNLYITASSFSDLNLIFWKSTDGGYNWTKKFDTISPNMYSGITRFFDSQNGISFTPNQGSLKTLNGFNSYSFGTWPSTYLMSIDGYGDSTIILGSCGVYCAWGISKDRGNTWPGTWDHGTGMCSPIDFEFINRDTILVITDVANQSAFFVTTFNGGLNWNDHLFTDENGQKPPPERFFKLCIKNKNEIYITARNGLTSGGYSGFGLIMKSTNLGKTWLRYETQFKENFFDMKFINDSIALVCGSNGLLFKWNSKTAIFTDINENSAGVGISIFPNPVHDRLFIQKDESIVLRKTLLTTILGEILFESSTATKEIDVSHYPQGVYFVHIETEKGKRVFRVVKE